MIDWSNKLQTVSKLRTLCIRYGKIFAFLLDKTCKISSCSRCGILPLRVETGRYSGLKIQTEYALFVIQMKQKMVSTFCLNVHANMTSKPNFLLLDDSNKLRNINENPVYLCCKIYC